MAVNKRKSSDAKAKFLEHKAKQLEDIRKHYHMYDHRGLKFYIIFEGPEIFSQTPLFKQPEPLNIINLTVLSDMGVKKDYEIIYEPEFLEFERDKKQEAIGTSVSKLSKNKHNIPQSLKGQADTLQIQIIKKR